jgi:hypothetical protein
MFPINANNELRSMKLFNKILDDYLSRYPTKYEEDCILLKSNNLKPFSNEKNALIQIIGEKTVLLFFKDFTEICMKVISKIHISDSEFEILLDNLKRTKHPLIYQHCSYSLAKLRREEWTRAERNQKMVNLSKPTTI